MRSYNVWINYVPWQFIYSAARVAAPPAVARSSSNEFADEIADSRPWFDLQSIAFAGPIALDQETVECIVDNILQRAGGRAGACSGIPEG
jgi:hypothetical protein